MGARFANVKNDMGYEIEIISVPQIAGCHLNSSLSRIYVFFLRIPNAKNGEEKEKEISFSFFPLTGSARLEVPKKSRQGVGGDKQQQQPVYES